MSHAECCGNYLPSGECCSAIYGTDRLVMVEDEQEPQYLDLFDPATVERLAAALWECGAYQNLEGDEVSRLRSAAAIIAALREPLP